MKDLQDYLRQEYEQAIDKHGLSLAPNDFLESLDFEEVAYYVFDDRSMSEYVETIENSVAEDYPLLEWDTNRFGELTMERIEEELRDITEDELADVRSDIADDESYARDPFGHYGISKSNFYGVT